MWKLLVTIKVLFDLNLKLLVEFCPCNIEPRCVRLIIEYLSQRSVIIGVRRCSLANRVQNSLFNARRLGLD